jgi:hypothetical protein
MYFRDIPFGEINWYIGFIEYLDGTRFLLQDFFMNFKFVTFNCSVIANYFDLY